MKHFVQSVITLADVLILFLAAVMTSRQLIRVNCDRFQLMVHNTFKFMVTNV